MKFMSLTVPGEKGGFPKKMQDRSTCGAQVKTLDPKS
jgi:hypothetical protein